MSDFPKEFLVYDHEQTRLIVRNSDEYETMISGLPQDWSIIELVGFSIDAIVDPITKQHGGWAAAVARSAIEQVLRERPDDLCSVLRRDWDRYNGASTIAQAIDLGLGVERAREVIEALQARDLTSNKIGDGDGT